MKGYSHGYKRDLSDGSKQDWCILRKQGGYIVAGVQARMDEAVIPFVEPAYGPFEKIADARSCYASQEDRERPDEEARIEALSQHWQERKNIERDYIEMPW